MQNPLFGDAGKPAKKSGKVVEPAIIDPALIELAQSLPAHLRLGTSSWNYPGWNGLVWNGEYPETNLSRYGLAAYAQHPLFRTVSVDRSFYRPLNVAQFAEYASQVGQHFRFVVKAPSLITDALVRDESGRGMRQNPNFLNAEQAVQMFVEPALEGLGRRLGALVFQISPLPTAWLGQMPKLIDRLHTLLKAIPDLKSIAPDGVVAVEVRDPQWLTPQFVDALRDTGATYCMGLHAKMPRITEQLPILRALWPGPLVCRWNLNPLHGAYGYEDAQALYSPYDKMMDPDPETRAALVRVISGTARAGQNVFVTLSNKAEGSAPLSVIELARAIRADNHPSGNT
ncbi:DUF72 domain-containing protein [Cellvibrio fibrivorans]|uniref:Uncharacterized protein YecE (DUF72 family) n=1 Tax=Cellvibrio fibrivorans TaxID=126350 RepID=A0ABU1UXQ1_9GAMM|nr:DUF72 domain-containing protein [Cellvibrio fibrivorans]MDR7089969.1 uncharacterized protein YecE (DUF72 family) [Cellvibrio fibrivorans]